MQQITHNNHFVPQLYLKNWSDDGVHIWAYRILVSHNNVSEWEYRPIRGVAYQRDLYTSSIKGKEVDDFEKFLENEFEKPAEEAIRKVIKNNPLSKADWERLASFLGAQDVRTPQSYIESSERWNKTLPDILQNTLEESVQKLKEKDNADKEDLFAKDSSDVFEDILEIDIVKGSESVIDQCYIKAEITVGRKLWLYSQNQLLTKTINVLKNHKWSIARSAHGYEWFTSDHPVVKLNYYGDGNYDLEGGWGKRGGNLFMPISPRHLIFTQIGEDLPDHFDFTSRQTKQLQKLIAEKAPRWIFAKKPYKGISKLHPRYVDAEAYNHEIKEWKLWHERQSQAEDK
jgi:hypothetical protein